MLPQPKGILRLPQLGRRSARKLRDKADFPRKGTTNQTVFTAGLLRSCQAFSRRSCTCSQTPFLLFMLLSYHTARKNASTGKNSQKNAPGMVCEMPGAYRAAGRKCSLHRMKKSDILCDSISPGRRPVGCPPNCLYSSTGARKMHPTGADRRDTRRRTTLYRR